MSCLASGRSRQDVVESLLQSLEVAIFGPAKRMWRTRTIVAERRKESRTRQSIQKHYSPAAKAIVQSNGEEIKYISDIPETEKKNFCEIISLNKIRLGVLDPKLLKECACQVLTPLKISMCH